MFCIIHKPNHKTYWFSGLLNDKLAIITKFTTVEYGQNSELSQLSEGDVSRCNARKLLVVKDLNCMVNKMKRILVHN